LYDVGRPTRLCVPAAGDDDAPDLVCHTAKLARTKPLRQAPSRPGDVTLTNRFGTRALRVGEPRELCVPTLADPISPPPPPPPQADFTLEVLPRTIDVVAGTRTAITATAHFTDGHDADVSGAVVWSSSDEDVARVVEDSTSGAFASAVGPGTAAITATDPATGVRSSDAGGDATIIVSWPLEKLTISPHAVSLLAGEHEGYTVIGHFTGGTTRNLTQRVVYASSNPGVAVATNQAGNRSRVEAIAPGTAVISATDPISSLTTTDASNDATLRVVSGLSYVVVRSGPHNQTRLVGESKRFTATGIFADGSTLNLTQRCEWWSMEPSVAVAPNTPGDRSRIDALSPGFTTIACREPASGKWSYQVPFWVLGSLQSIWAGAGLQPSEYPRTGQSVTLAAVGSYEGGGSRYLTQDVAWDTRDPELLFCPNEPGNRSRVVALAAGDARVYATDPATGVVSNDAIVPILGELVDLVVETPAPYYLFDAIPVGAQAAYSVRGIFEHGTLNLSFRKDYVLTSSDPGVAAVVDGRRVRGVSPGT
ncbi:MAG: Ig-like domain-containing protein, partial [Candidatus Binatia bacterium]